MDLVAHLFKARDFSANTFGMGSRSSGIIAHIKKELVEIEANPGDLEEWIDVATLAFDGAWRQGFSPRQITDALAAKLEKNMGRKWPDYRTMRHDEPIEHDRSMD